MHRHREHEGRPLAEAAPAGQATPTDTDGARPDSSSPSTWDPLDQAIASRAAFEAALDRLVFRTVADELTIGIEGADADALELLVSHWVTDVVTGAPLLFAAVGERADAHRVQPVRELKPSPLLARDAS